MKFLGSLVIGFSMLATNALAVMPDYILTKVNADSEKISVGFETTEIHSSMCQLQAKDLKIENNVISFIPALNFNSFCLSAFGPHSGVVELNRSELEVGLVKVIIKGMQIGEIEVTEDGAVLVDEVHSGGIRPL